MEDHPDAKPQEADDVEGSGAQNQEQNTNEPQEDESHKVPKPFLMYCNLSAADNSDNSLESEA